MPAIRTVPREYRFSLGTGRLHHLVPAAPLGERALCGIRRKATVPRPVPGYLICAGCLRAQHPTRQT